MATDAGMGGNQDASAFGTEAITGADHGDQSGDQSVQDSAVSQEAQGAQNTAPASTVPTWDGSQFTLKYRGKQVVPESRDQLINWAQYGYDANERNRLLTAKEKELETKFRAMSEYEQFDTLLKQRPELQQAIQEVVTKFKSGNQQGAVEQISEEVPQQLQPYVNGLLSKIGNLEKQVGDISGWKKTMDDQTADSKVESEINGLKKAHADHDWDSKDEEGYSLSKQILKHAFDNNFPSLEAAYRDFMWDSVKTNAKADALKAAEDAKRQASKAGIVSKGTTGAPPPVAPKRYDPRGKSWNQVGQDALNEALQKVTS